MKTKPLNPYSPEWNQYWIENPCLHRGVGADAAEDLSGEEVEESTASNDSEGGGDAPQVAEWASSIEDENLRGTLGKYESQEDALKAIGYKAPETDWRDGLPDDLKKTADRFTSKEDAIRAINNLQKREGQVRVPGKDATDEEKAAYYKAVGVPESPDGYDWPDLGDDATDAQKQSRDAWGAKLHELKVPGETAKKLAAFLQEETQSALASQVEEDKAFAQQQEDALKNEWKGEAYEQNKTLANRAFGELANRAGVNIEDLQQIETKDGRFLMDRAEMSRIFAVIGKEMAEGTIGPTLTSGEIETAEEQLRELRGKISQAQTDGNSKLANQLYQKEQGLIAKIKGNKSVVGADGRSV